MTVAAPKTPACCIVYTTDRGYLFPTLVSAIQARRHSSAEKADVAIFCVDMDEQVERAFRPVCEGEDIGLVSVASSVIEGQTAMLARLFLNRFVPSRYTQYLYLDGDVHILGSLDPLIDTAVPPGSFLAANDPITFLLADNGPQSKELQRHLRSLGLSDAQASAYFNSGVLRIHRDGWEAIGERAWQHFQESETGKRFPDQDALNVVAHEQRLPLSLAWNYPVFMRNSRVESCIQPRIKHFMSSPKPWHGAFPPWGQQECRPYAEALELYPELEPYRRNMSFQDRAVYHLQQRGKRYIETITWGFSKRRHRILHYEATCKFDAVCHPSLGAL